MFSDALLLDARAHADALERFAIEALLAGQTLRGFRYSDRRCRITPLPKAHHFALRAQALSELGYKTAAIEDLKRALSLAPEDIPSNRRMLEWGDKGQKILSAERLLNLETESGALARAISVLRKAGRSAFASFRHIEGSITGWAAWQANDAAELWVETDNDKSIISLSGDPAYTLNAPGLIFTSIKYELHKASLPARLSVRASGREIFSLVVQHSGDQIFEPRGISKRQRQKKRRTTVIVPVYDDYECTRNCLESLLPQLSREKGIDAIVVNDASPDRDIQNFLSNINAHPLVCLVENSFNMGFVASVNRAIDRAGDVDVVLLNSDTLLPIDAIERLRSAARSSAHIGTVTPLSNNGEFTSLPIPFVNNSIAGLAEVNSRDRIAQRSSTETLVDIPNGIGFCLYITAECLKKVSRLSSNYYRGYLEDADLCLRAREFGFRNVCAVSVFVGHIGSRSFKDEKRLLVMRNLGALEFKYPNYRAECAAFMLGDPLAPYRAAIEYEFQARSSTSKLLVNLSSLTREIAEQRAESQSPSAHVITLSVEHREALLTFSHQPITRRFNTNVWEDLTLLCEAIRSLKPSGVEIIGCGYLPPGLHRLLRELNLPIDIFFACGCQHPEKNTGSNNTPLSKKPLQQPSTEWADIIENARELLTPSKRATDFAQRTFKIKRPLRQISSVSTSSEAFEPIFNRRSDVGITLGIVMPALTASEHSGLRETLQLLTKDTAHLSCVILGETADDINLMGLRNVHVTGAIESDELTSLCKHLMVDLLFLGSRLPIFGTSSETWFFNANCPKAYFDWSRRRLPVRSKDITLDPTQSPAVIAAKLKEWIGRSIDR